MAKWFDPLTERWHTMPEPVKPPPSIEVPEGIYTRAARIMRENSIWEAVTATATASQMSQETPCHAGSGSDESAS
jgi:hypothetical protein